MNTTKTKLRQRITVPPDGHGRGPLARLHAARHAGAEGVRVALPRRGGRLSVRVVPQEGLRDHGATHWLEQTVHAARYSPHVQRPVAGRERGALVTKSISGHLKVGRKVGGSSERVGRVERASGEGPNGRRNGGGATSIDVEELFFAHPGLLQNGPRGSLLQGLSPMHRHGDRRRPGLTSTTWLPDWRSTTHPRRPSARKRRAATIWAIRPIELPGDSTRRRRLGRVEPEPDRIAGHGSCLSDRIGLRNGSWQLGNLDTEPARLKVRREHDAIPYAADPNRDLT